MITCYFYLYNSFFFDEFLSCRHLNLAYQLSMSRSLSTFTKLDCTDSFSQYDLNEITNVKNKEFEHIRKKYIL